VTGAASDGCDLEGTGIQAVLVIGSARRPQWARHGTK